jgi:hypothetical protein
MKAVSLVDDLDATIRELDDLAEAWEQAKAFEQARVRLRFLSSTVGEVVEDLTQVNSSLAGNNWSLIRPILLRERPDELDFLGRIVMADDVSFMRVVNYFGFVHGVLTALHSCKSGEWLCASESSVK